MAIPKNLNYLYIKKETGNKLIDINKVKFAKNHDDKKN